MNVFLLKSNDTTTKCSNDRYVDFLKAKNSPKICSVEQINLLKFNYQNLDLLKSKLFTFFLHKNYEKKKFLTQNFKCLILTSRQTIEAIQEAFKEHLQIDSNQQHQESNICTDLQDHSHKLIVYCVGESTANRFKCLINLFLKLNPDLDRHLILRLVNDTSKGEHKQNAIELSKLIKQDFDSICPNLEQSESFKYALYPCSSIRRDDLSKSLNENQISFEEINVYNTGPCERGQEKFLKSLSEHLNENNCLVFFSPSGCDAVFLNSNLTHIINSHRDKFKFISIGPSTSSKLKQLVDYNQLVELTEPTPQALWDKLNPILNEN